MNSLTPQLAIDGKWVVCRPPEDYGFLGLRCICELGDTPGQPSKKLLIRRTVWPESGMSAGTPPIQLAYAKASDSCRANLRPLAIKQYEQATPQADGFVQTTEKVVQQDVTGLIPLKNAIVEAANMGRPEKIWQLFHNACQALDEFGKPAGLNKTVQLQCPESLAVNADNRVILLDAEIRLAGGLLRHSEAKKVYTQWFGSKESSGFANSKQASLMHANALLLYFRHLLGELLPETASTGQAVLTKVIAKVEQIRPGGDLDDLEEWIRTNGEDWNIYAAAEEQPSAVVISAGQSAPESVQPKRRRLSLLRASLWLNLILVIAVVILWLLRSTGTSGRDAASPSSQRESNLTFSSYCVVFPTQGTIGEKVNNALKELFPGKVLEIKMAAEERDKLLSQKMEETIKSISEPEKTTLLLAQLSKDHSIRFKGFGGEPGESLSGLIERGGIFTMTKSPREQHGSLLQADSPEKILREAGLNDNQESRTLLGNLKKATAEYASLKDALSIIGNRIGYLIQVEPSAAVHDEVRRKLLTRLDNPVFVSRPLLAFFDGVDPTADTGTGFATYNLRLDRKCFFRAASLEDRKNVDFQNNASNDRMKWRSFEASRLIFWKPIPLTKKNGRTEAVASFDIAVVVQDKVVLFRNQTILLGETRVQVLMQARNYITMILGLEIQAIEDAVSVRQQGDQFTGALSYSYLAEQVTKNSSGDDKDLQLLKLSEFTELKEREDNF